MALRVLAPAKVNLGLWITGLDDDGYHKIVTLFYKIPLFDELYVEEWEGPFEECERLKRESENTVHRALRVLSEYVKRDICLKIGIEKRIPSGAGLGGGSSDAAAVLRVANSIFDLGLSESELMKVGSEVGADVPFFLMDGRAAIGRGRGYDLERVDIEIRGDWILIFPNVSVSTSVAYDLFDREGVFTPPQEAERKVYDLVEALKGGVLPPLENDFERVILPRFEGVRRAKERLVESGWKALMSGSGSSVFGIGKGELLLKEEFKVWHWRE